MHTRDVNGGCQLRLPLKVLQTFPRSKSSNSSSPLSILQFVGTIILSFSEKLYTIESPIHCFHKASFYIHNVIVDLATSVLIHQCSSLIGLDYTRVVSPYKDLLSRQRAFDNRTIRMLFQCSWLGSLPSFDVLVIIIMRRRTSRIRGSSC